MKKKLIYIVYGLWVFISLLAKILGWTGWGFALSWLWFPLGIILTVAFGITLSVQIGDRVKKNIESSVPKTCDNCLFGETAKYDKNGKCLGEALDDNIKKGEKACSYYKRNSRITKTSE